MSLKNVLPKRKMVYEFKERYSAWASEGFPKCDEKMINILPHFNAFDGVATIHCCEGHREKKMIPHIIFVTTAGGFETISYIYKLLIRKVLKENIKNDFKNYVDPTLIQLTITPRTITNNDVDTWYNAVVLGIGTYREKTVDTIFRLLIEVFQERNARFSDEIEIVLIEETINDCISELVRLKEITKKCSQDIKKELSSDVCIDISNKMETDHDLDGYHEEILKRSMKWIKSVLKDINNR